jgi:hypothetical protein
MTAHDDKEIASLRSRLNELDAERSTLTARLKGLQSQAEAGSSSNSASASINGESRAAEKIALFRRLFAGRTDVMPLRWENRNTGKSGYAPACANEWVRERLWSADLNWGSSHMTDCSPVKIRCRRVVLEISSHCHFSGAHATTATVSSWILIFMPIATNGHFLPPLAV